MAKSIMIRSCKKLLVTTPQKTHVSEKKNHLRLTRDDYVNFIGSHMPPILPCALGNMKQGDIVNHKNWIYRMMKNAPKTN